MNMKKIISLAGLVLFGCVALCAQTPAGQLDKIVRALEEAASANIAPRGNLTAEDIFDEINETGAVDACRLASLVSDSDYLKTLDEDRISAVADAFAYASADKGCKVALLRLVTVPLSNAVYDETSADFPMNAFYAMSAVALGYNPYFQQEVREWAFGQVTHSSLRSSRGHEGVWGALVLNNTVLELEDASGEVYRMSAQERKETEARLRAVIAQFDWLKYERADYLTPHIKSSDIWNKDNQTVLLQLFAQVNGFVAKARESLTFGGNILGSTDFSSDMKNFYLHHPTPGTDGRGHWANSPNGRKHQTVALLVQALALSYSANGDPAETSAKLISFIREYTKTAPVRGGFAHYLFMALHALRNGDALLDDTNINGWEAGQAAKTDLYKTIRKEYPLIIGINAAQGAAETTVEWEVVGGVFVGIFKGIGLGGKAIGRAVVNKLPAQTLMNLAAVEIRAQHALRVSKAGIKAFMKKAGWKAVAAGGTVAAVSTDSARRASKNDLAY